MKYLYRIKCPRSAREEGLFTEIGITKLNLHPDTILVRQDGTEQIYNEVIRNESYEDARDYHLTSSSDMLGSYSYAELEKDPHILKEVAFVWTEGFDEWREPSYYPELDILLTTSDRAEKDYSSATNKQYKRLTPPPIPPFAAGNWKSGGDEGLSNRLKRSKTAWEHFVYCLRNYVNFEGRASISEYWYFMLFLALGYIAVSLISLPNYICDFPNSVFRGPAFLLSLLSDFYYLRSPIQGLYILAMLLPFLSATSRRFHDTNKSGLLSLLLLIPVGGSIAVFVMMLQKGTPYENKYGPAPEDTIED